MRTPFLPQHAKALTVLLCSIRPDWSAQYVHDAVSRMPLIDDDLERICRVAIRGALTGKIRKPDVLAMKGEHWKARADLASGDEPIRSKLCGTCGQFHRPVDECSGPVVISRSHSEHAAIARRTLKAARTEETHG